MRRVIVLLVLVSFAVGAYFLSRDNSHMSETVIELYNESPCFSESDLNRKLLSEQIALMKSKEAIGNGLKICQLETKTEYSREECIDLLNSYLEIEINDETNLITIRTYAGSERQAQVLNYVAVKGYEKILIEWCSDWADRRQTTRIYEHKVKVKTQEEAIAEWKKRLVECSTLSAGPEVISYTKSRLDKEQAKFESLKSFYNNEGRLESFSPPIIYHQRGWNNFTFKVN